MRFSGVDGRSGQDQESRRLAWAVLLSVLAHAFVASLSLGGQGTGLPGFDLPWRERRAEVPDVRLVLVPEREPEPLAPPPVPAAAAEPAPPVESSPDRPPAVVAAPVPPPEAPPATAVVVSREEALPAAPAEVAAAPPPVVLVKRSSVSSPSAPTGVSA